MTEYSWLKYDDTDGKVYIRDTENAWTSLSDLIGLVAHAESHESGGTDEIDLTGLNGSGLTGIASSDDIDELSTITTTITSSATPTPARASTRTVLEITALGADAELQNPTGTPAKRDLLWVVITDDGTARALTYDTDYADKTGDGLPSTTTISKELNLLFVYNSTDSKWDLVSSVEEG